VLSVSIASFLITTCVAYATLLADGTGSGTKDSLWCGLAYDDSCDIDFGLTTVQNFELCTTAKAGFGWEAVIAQAARLTPVRQIAARILARPEFSGWPKIAPSSPSFPGFSNIHKAASMDASAASPSKAAILLIGQLEFKGLERKRVAARHTLQGGRPGERRNCRSPGKQRLAKVEPLMLLL
jgi:hypothetical protein